MKKVLLSAVTAFVVVFALLGCSCKHEFKSQTVREATCGADGEKLLTCEKCEETSVEVIPKTGEHDNEEEILKEATCAEDGKKKLTCKRCGETKTEIIPKTDNHEFEEEILKTATCSAEGEKKCTCKICQITENQIIPKDDAVHNETFAVTKQPTCGAAGEAVYTCADCGKTRTAEVPATGNHNYVGTQTTAPTFDNYGVMTYTCTLCGISYTEGIAKPDSGWTYGYDKSEFPVMTSDKYYLGKFFGSCEDSQQLIVNGAPEKYTTAYVYIDSQSNVYLKLRLFKPSGKRIICTYYPSYTLMLDGQEYLFMNDATDDIIITCPDIVQKLKSGQSVECYFHYHANEYTYYKTIFTITGIGEIG